MDYESWLCEVIQLLEEHPSYLEALDVGPYETLEEMRSDEPKDVFEQGDTPEQYVRFLIEEWAIFGPEGE